MGVRSAAAVLCVAVCLGDMPPCSLFAIDDPKRPAKIEFKPFANHIEYASKDADVVLPRLPHARCAGDTGYFRQTCCDLDASLPFDNVKNGSAGVVRVASFRGQVGGNLTARRCLPRIVIGGVQKGGSTALAAVLSAHPNVGFAPHKELHYLDGRDFGPSGWCKGTGFYLSRMRPAEWAPPPPGVVALPASRGPAVGEFVGAEATPFYIASPIACAHFAAELPPSSKLVVIFREPIARLYSEFQMERRRIEPQVEFLRNLQRHSAAFLLCYARALTYGTFPKSIPACLHRKQAGGLMSVDRENRFQMLMSKIADTVRIIKRVAKPVRAETTRGRDFPQGCVGRFVEACFAKVSHLGRAMNFDVAACTPKLALAKPSFAEKLQRDASYLLYCVAMGVVQNTTTLADLGPCLASFNSSLPADAESFAALRAALTAHLRGESEITRGFARPPPQGGRRLAEEDTKPDLVPAVAGRELAKFVAACFSPNRSNDLSYLQFQTRRCYPVQTIERQINKTQLIEEAEALEACAEKLFGAKDKVASDGDAALKFQQTCKPRANGGITYDYVYRSLYATQIHRCFAQGVKHDQLVLVDGDAFRADPLPLVRAVEAAAGLPTFDYAPDLVSPNHTIAEAAQREAIKAAFPGFDERIGWSIHGTYDKEGLPDDVANKLRAFFKPHNAEFFNLLGRTLPWPE